MKKKKKSDGTKGLIVKIRTTICLDVSDETICNVLFDLQTIFIKPA